MIRMAKGLQHRLLAIALYITVIYGYVIFVHNAQFPVNLPPVPDRAGPAFHWFHTVEKNSLAQII